MEYFSVTKQLRIEYGHRVPNHTSKCKNVHGHSGLIEATVVGPLVKTPTPDAGMVIDFGDLKALMVQEIEMCFDHSLILGEDDSLVAILESLPGSVKSTDFGRNGDLFSCWLRPNLVGPVYVLRGTPTAEYLAYVCYTLLSRTIDKGDVFVSHVRFWETPTSVAQYPVTPSLNPNLTGTRARP